MRPWYNLRPGFRRPKKKDNIYFIRWILTITYHRLALARFSILGFVVKKYIAFHEQMTWALKSWDHATYYFLMMQLLYAFLLSILQKQKRIWALVTNKNLLNIMAKKGEKRKAESRHTCAQGSGVRVNMSFAFVLYMCMRIGRTICMSQCQHNHV